MATRFLIVHAESIDIAEQIGALINRCGDLMPSCSQGRLRVYLDGNDEWIPFTPTGGGLIGYAFRRSNTAERIFAVDPETSEAAVRSRGRSLIATLWGGYIGVISRAGGDEVEILRDPSGSMPCYVWRYDQGVLISSDIETLLASGLFKPEIDWNFIERHLLAFDYRTEDTGFVGLKELLAGFRLTLTPKGAATEALWSPWDYVPSGQPLSCDDAVGALRSVVQACVGGWGRCFKRPLLGLSGGLDSSILAAVLSTNCPDLAALTLATKEAEGDERLYAKMVSDHLGVDLIERLHQFDPVDVLRTTSGHLPRPVQFAFGQSSAAIRKDIYDELSTDAFFTGIGGDNVFCYIRSASPWVDRLLGQGIGLGLLTTFLDVCRVNDCTLAEAAMMGFRTLRTRPRAEPNPETTFLRSRTPPQRPAFHPWMVAPDGAKPGKAAHVRYLARIQGTIDGFSRKGQVPMILPLLSQPIMEACLSIPTWAWIDGGRDRVLARRAFEGDLPPEIVWRRSKGGPSSFACEIIERNKAKLRPFLRDGVLAGKGFLDTGSLDQALDPATPVRSPEDFRLALLAETEAWLRHWGAR